MAREAANIVVQIGREETPGTPVSGQRTLCALDIDLSPELDVKRYRARGKRITTTSVLNRKWAMGDFSGVASYNELALIMFNLIGSEQPSVVGTGGFGWTFTPNSESADSPKPFTARIGDAEAAQIFAFMQAKTLELKATRESVEINGSLVAFDPNNAGALTTLTDEVQAITASGTVTGGTYTITFSGQTTSAIAYNASNAAIQAALEALSNIGVGEALVTGGPLPSKRVHIRFALTLGGINQPEITISSASLTGGGSYQPSTLLQGGAAVGQIAESPISGSEINLYVDTTFGGLGGTIIGCPLETRISLPERFNEKWCLNRSNTSFTETVGIATEPTIEFDVEYNSQARALYDAVVTQALPFRFIRFDALGSNIGAGADHKVQWDFAASIRMAKELKDRDGVFGYTFGFDIKHNPGWGKAMSCFIVNTQSFF